MPKYPSENKSKARALITQEHLVILESHFKEDPKPSKDIRACLSEKVKLSEESIRIWFQNRRTKARSNGEIPVICRDRGNRLISSSQMQPIYIPQNSPQSNYSSLTNSSTNPSPTNISFDSSCLPYSTSVDYVFNSFPTDYSQFTLNNFDLASNPIEDSIANHLLALEYLSSLQFLQ